MVDDDGLVHIEGDDLSLVRWNHRPALLRAALQRFGGMADWKPRWHILAVPTEAFMDCARRARATSPGLARKRSALLLTIRARIKLRMCRWMAEEQCPFHNNIRAVGLILRSVIGAQNLVRSY